MWGDPGLHDQGEGDPAGFFGIDEAGVDIAGVRFVTPARYVPKTPVGRGAFGVVWYLELGGGGGGGRLCARACVLG